MNLIKIVFLKWLPIAIIILFSGALNYILIQQNYRMSVNDPQIQISEDIAEKVKNGSEPTAFTLGDKIDISKSLDTFIIILDKDSKVISSNALLNSKIPSLPQGVIDSAKANGQNRITWQPDNNIRLATIITRIDNDNGFVIVGRSLREVEIRETNSLYITLAAITSALIVAFLVIFILGKISIHN